jgi:hypothetical protein
MRPMLTPMSLVRRTHLRLAGVILIVGLHATAAGAETNARPNWMTGWTVDAAIYAWATAIDGTVGVGGVDASVDNSFADTLEQSDSLLAFMGHAEARRGHWGLLLDTVYVKLGYDDVAVGTAEADATSELVFVELGGFYEFGRWPLGGPARDVSWSLQGLGGARYSYVGNEIDVVGGPRLDQSKDWVDPFVGLRAAVAFSDSWDASLRGDVGGFGLGSDFSWQLVALLGYRFPLFGADAKAAIGYRALSQDYDSGSGSERFKWDTTLHGPILGVSVRF